MAKKKTNRLSPNVKAYKKLKDAADPLVKYLCENHHPHVTAIVTPTGVQLLEGIRTATIVEHLRD